MRHPLDPPNLDRWLEACIDCKKCGASFNPDDEGSPSLELCGKCYEEFLNE